MYDYEMRYMNPRMREEIELEIQHRVAREVDQLRFYYGGNRVPSAYNNMDDRAHTQAELEKVAKATKRKELNKLLLLTI